MAYVKALVTKILLNVQISFPQKLSTIKNIKCRKSNRAHIQYLTNTFGFEVR